MYSGGTFGIDEKAGRFGALFFDHSDTYQEKTALWQIANIGLGLLDLFYGVGSKHGGVVFAEDFVARFKEGKELNKALKAEMMATDRYKKAAASAEKKDETPK